VTRQQQRIATLSVPKARIVEAASELFSERGAAGTSLQMIADVVGVTKAAVYHQFHTKDEIVLAVGGLIFDRLKEIAALAEAEASPRRARGVLTDGLIELAIENRRIARFIHHDPFMLRLFDEHVPFRRIMERLNAALLGGQESPEARVTVAMLVTSIGGAVIYPLASDIDDDTLRSQLGRLAHCLLRTLK